MAKINGQQLSKTISHALRHEPWLYELELDEMGWVDVSILIEALAQHRRSWRELSLEDLTEMMRGSDDRSQGNGTSIRAFVR